MRSLWIAAVATFVASTAYAKPIERRLYPRDVEASSFLWNDWNKFVENYHQNYIGDDDATTAWVEGVAGTGAGQWVRLNTTKLDTTTAVRLKIRNGYQKSKALFAANARAKDVTVKLLPSGTTQKATLADKDGWQEITVAQASGALEGIELTVDSVYDGSKYEDLCLSDVQVFATSEAKENPSLEKSNRTALMAWRTERKRMASQLAGQKIELPTYSAYVTTTKEVQSPDDSWTVAYMLAWAKKDAVISKEFAAELATAGDAISAGDTLPQATIAPMSKQKFLVVDGLEQTSLQDLAEGWFDEHLIRLPVLGLQAVMFSDQLRVIDEKTKMTRSDFEAVSESKKCKNAAWVLRGAAAAKEAAGPSQVRALFTGVCGMVEGREGKYMDKATELLVYDASGRLALVIGPTHLEAYRWTTENGKPRLAGARSLLAQGNTVDAVARTTVATK